MTNWRFRRNINFFVGCLWTISVKSKGFLFEEIEGGWRLKKAEDRWISNGDSTTPRGIL